MSLKFEVKRQGFDVSIGEVDFFFETTEGNMMRIMDIDESSEVKMNEIDEELAKFDIVNTVDKAEVKKALGKAKEKVQLLYDVLLGEGAFDKIYSKYPDVIQLYSIYQAVQDGVLEKMSDVVKENQVASSERVQELKLNAQKKKKIKK